MRVSAAVRLLLHLTAVAQAAHALSLPFRRDFQPQSWSTGVSFVNAEDPYNFQVVNLDGDNQIIYVSNMESSLSLRATSGDVELVELESMLNMT